MCIGSEQSRGLGKNHSSIPNKHADVATIAIGGRVFIVARDGGTLIEDPIVSARSKEQFHDAFILFRPNAAGAVNQFSAGRNPRGSVIKNSQLKLAKGSQGFLVLMISSCGPTGEHATVAAGHVGENAIEAWW